MVAANARTAIAFTLSAGNAHDAPEGRKLLQCLQTQELTYLLMDRAYADDQTRAVALERGFLPVVPPRSNRKQPWNYDRELYKRRNEIERLFRCIKAYRRIFTRYDKLDVMFLAFLTFALIIEALR